MSEARRLLAALVALTKNEINGHPIGRNVIARGNGITFSKLVDEARDLIEQGSGPGNRWESEPPTADRDEPYSRLDTAARAESAIGKGDFPSRGVPAVIADAQTPGLAAPAPPAPIDVERLARAIESGPAMYWKHRELADGSTEAVLDAERYARDLAAAYEAME